MNFENLQKAWQKQNASAKIAINTDVLLKEIKRNQQQFRATIFWRDVREVGASALMAIFFLGWGWRWHWWSLYLLSFGCFFVAAFFLIDRRIQQGKQRIKSESLHACVQSSLFQVNHQIWLLKNIFWWYLLPILIGLGAVSVATLWHKQLAGLATLIGLGAFYVIFYGLVYWGVYWLNQFVVRKDLEPRRQELETLLASLE
jgi:MFS family permease